MEETTKPKVRVRASMSGCNSRLSEENHFFKTPAHCTQALLDREQFAPFVWDPCCGDGALAEVLVKNGYRVIASDLIHRGYGNAPVDFFQTNRLACTSMVINPPFKCADKFVLHAWRLGVKKLAVFQRLAWLEGALRYDTIFSQMPIAKVYVFSKRQTLWRGDDPNPKSRGGAVPFAWFVFQEGHQSSPELHWIRE